MSDNSIGYETITLGPPFKGLEQPYSHIGDPQMLPIYNPLAEPGKCSTHNNWFLHRDGVMLRLTDGSTEVGNAITTAGRTKMIASYTSSTKHDLIFMGGRNLLYFDLKNNSGPTTVVTNMLAADTATRASWVRFRNRILIATMADGLWWYDPETRTARKCGVAAPGSGPTLAAGVAGILTGTFKGAVSFVNDQGHESNLSPTGSVTVTAQKIAWSSIPTGPTGTVKRKLYRSASGQSLPLLLTTLNDNVTTTFTDNNADTTLGAPNEGNFTVPSETIRQIAVQGSRVLLVDADGKTVWYSNIDADTAIPNFEAFPLSLSLQFSFLGGTDYLKAVSIFGQSAFMWGDLGGYRVMGDPSQNIYIERLPWNIGLWSPFAWTMTPYGQVFVDNQKKLRLFDGASIPKEVGSGSQHLFDASLSADGLDGMDVCYDELNQVVQINFVTTFHFGGGLFSNDKTLLYYPKIDEVITADFIYEVSYYDATDHVIYASTGGSTIFRNAGYVVSVVHPLALDSPYDNQRIEFLPITPIPGDKSYFIRLVLVVKAQPIVSGVVPMLKVEYSYNDGAFYEYKYVDVSKDYLVWKEGESAVKRVIEVPLYRRAESVTIRISPAANLASVQNGQEIYAAMIHWAPNAEAKMDGRRWPSGGNLRSQPSQ